MKRYRLQRFPLAIAVLAKPNRTVLGSGVEASLDLITLFYDSRWYGVGAIGKRGTCTTMQIMCEEQAPSASEDRTSITAQLQGRHSVKLSQGPERVCLLFVTYTANDSFRKAAFRVLLTDRT